MASGSVTRSTLEDLYREEGKAELIGGRVVRLMPSGDLPSVLALEIAVSLRAFARGSTLVVTHIFGGLAVTFESQGVRELVQHLPTHRRNRLMPNRLRRCV